jgi:hypothetical protein
MVSQTSGNIHVIVCMVNQVETPEKRYLVLYKVTKPASKEIQYQKSQNNDHCVSAADPIDQSEMIRLGPSGDEYNAPGNQRMYNEMNGSEPDIGGGMPAFRLFVLGMNERHGVFNQP